MELKVNNIKTILFNNLNVKQIIFKNTFWLAFSMVLNKLLGLVLLIYAARILGAEGYGKFTFAIAFISLLMLFSDFGLSPIITREFAKTKEKIKDFFSLLSLKAVLLFISFILILAGTFLTIQEKDIQKIILILSFFFLINGFVSIFYALFHAYQKMEYESWSEIIQNFLLFIFGLFILFKFPSVENFALIYSFSALLTMIFAFFIFNSKISKFKIEWNFIVWKKFLKMSWPLALMGLFGVIYSYTDSVMLGYLNMIKETGLYNAASKIAMVNLAPTGLIAASFYPALSRFSDESKEKFQRVWDNLLKIMIILAIPLVVGGIVLAQKIIYYFYTPEFAPAIFAFQFLILTAGIIILYRPFYDAMIILNQQSKMFWITFFGAIVNVFLNLILIPRYSFYGAAIATTITNLVNFCIIIIFIKKFTFLRILKKDTFLTIIVSFLASGLMYFVLKQFWFYNVNLFLIIFIAIIIYLLSIIFFKKFIFKFNSFI